MTRNTPITDAIWALGDAILSAGLPGDSISINMSKEFREHFFREEAGLDPDKALARNLLVNDLALHEVDADLLDGAAAFDRAVRKAGFPEGDVVVRLSNAVASEFAEQLKRTGYPFYLSVIRFEI